jgi:hypothetical protein
VEEEIDMNIIDKVQVNTQSYNCSLVLHLLIAGAEERQGTITSNMNLLHYSSSCTKL